MSTPPQRTPQAPPPQRTPPPPPDVVPEWVISYTNMWRGLLFLHEWEIAMVLSPMPSGDPSGGTKASVTITQNALAAQIYLLNTVPRDPASRPAGEIAQWQITIIHELLHIKFGRITAFVEHVLIPMLGTVEAREVAGAAFTGEHEPAVEGMARLLHSLLHGEKAAA